VKFVHKNKNTPLILGCLVCCDGMTQTGEEKGKLPASIVAIGKVFQFSIIFLGFSFAKTYPHIIKNEK